MATKSMRGLTEETLRLAKFNSEQPSMLELFRVTREQAEQFAEKAGLKAKKVEYLAREANRKYIASFFPLRQPDNCSSIR